MHSIIATTDCVTITMYLINLYIICYAYTIIATWVAILKFSYRNLLSTQYGLLVDSL